jgi:hypothetical protein
MFRWTAAAAAIILAFLAGYYWAVLKQDQLPDQSPGLTQSQTIPAQQPGSVAPNDLQIPSTGDEVAQEIPAVISLSEEIAAAESIQPPDLSVQTGTSVQTETTAQQSTVDAKNTDELAQQEQPVQEQPVQGQPGNEEQLENIPAGKPVHYYSDYDDTGNDYSSSEGWSAGGSFSPVYAYRNISIQAEELPPGTIPEESYYNDGEDPLYSWSGGLDLAYDFSGRLGFQTGAYLSNLGMVSPEVIAYESEGSKDIYKISSSTGIIDVKLHELPTEFVDNSVRRDSATNTLYIDSEVYQLFSYVEVPLVLNYRILNKRLGLQLNGGLSPGIMTNNETYFHYEGDRIDLDRSGQFYSMIYNSVVGFGFRYSITKQLSITLDPTFKYSLNSIRKDHSIGYHPYSFSVFTGLRLAF